MPKILGNALKKAREQKGISLRGIADSMKLNLRYLNALENEDFALIPGNFYIRYYIRSYLQAIGVDDAPFFNTYQDYLDSVLRQDSPSRPQEYYDKVKYAKFKRSKLVFWLVVVLAAVLIILFCLVTNPGVKKDLRGIGIGRTADSRSAGGMHV